MLGRRRVGKSSLLRHACHKFGGLYHQAIEGTPEQQLAHLVDEWPYRVSADATLPSILQKWIDQQLPKHKTLLIISGSSQSMLFSQFLHGDAPLYGPARFCLRLKPLSYYLFCRILGLKFNSAATFERYSITGGIPHYWKLLDKKPWLEQIDRLFFQPSAILAEDPRLILMMRASLAMCPRPYLI